MVTRNVVSVSLDDKTLADIDALRSELGVSRSAFLKFCVAQYIRSQRALDSFNDMMNTVREQKLKEIAENI